MKTVFHRETASPAIATHGAAVANDQASFVENADVDDRAEVGVRGEVRLDKYDQSRYEMTASSSAGLFLGYLTHRNRGPKEPECWKNCKLADSSSFAAAFDSSLSRVRTGAPSNFLGEMKIVAGENVIEDSWKLSKSRCRWRAKLHIMGIATS